MVETEVTYTTVRVIHGVHGNTTSLGPGVTLDSELVLGARSLCSISSVYQSPTQKKKRSAVFYGVAKVFIGRNTRYRIGEMATYSA